MYKNKTFPSERILPHRFNEIPNLKKLKNFHKLVSRKSLFYRKLCLDLGELLSLVVDDILIIWANKSTMIIRIFYHPLAADFEVNFGDSGTLEDVL